MDAEILREKVQALLWKGKIREASLLLSNENKDIELKIEQTKVALSALEDKKAVIDQLRSGQKEADIQPPHAKTTYVTSIDYSPTLNPLQKSKRNRKVVELATNIAEDGIVNTYDVIEEIEKNDIDLGVPEARKSTAVSNILLRTGKFQKVDNGVYRVPDTEDKKKKPGLFR